MSLAVLHVCEPSDGGAPSVVAKLAVDQVRRGWDVTVAAPMCGFLLDRARTAGATTVAWDATGRPAAAGREARSLHAIIRRTSPDVVLLHSWKAGLAGRLAVRGRIPTVYQPHGWAFLVVSGPRRALLRSWERMALRWTTSVVCVSEFERARALEARIRVDTVIPNGVDTRRFASADGSARARACACLGASWPVAPDAPTAVCAGRLAVEKGQDVLLAAWPRVRAGMHDAQLVVVGDGPRRAELERAGVVGVTFVGSQSDAATWLAASDVVVVPSQSEASSLVLREAMATGRSVVATDVGDAASALVGAGAVVPPGDAPVLAAVVGARLGDPARAAAEGRGGRATAETRYDDRIWAERFATLVARVAQGG